VAQRSKEVKEKLMLVENKILKLTKEFTINWDRIYPHDLSIVGDVSPIAFQTEISKKRIVLFSEARERGVAGKVYLPKLCVYNENLRAIMFAFPHSDDIIELYEFLISNMFPQMEKFFDSILEIE
jgi:hypothetical protein